jgi:hypothetical protein
MTQSTKKSLFSPEVYQDCLNRVGRLTPGTAAEWGSMTAAQMLSHCAEIQEVSNGKELQNTPFLAKLFKGMIRNMVVNEKPYPKNTKTHPQYKQTSDRDFETEKKRLLNALDMFVNADDERAGRSRHPLFGEMSTEERGWSMYKHLDHHLTQFGV